MGVVLAVGVLGTAGAFVLGPWALRLVYDVDLSGRTLAMLSLSSALYMLALATAQAVIALQGHALVAVGWLIGVVTFLLGTWLSADEVFRRIEIVDRVAGGVRAGAASPPPGRRGAHAVVGDGGHHRHALRDVTLLLGLTAGWC
jgi:hypothetical protein